MQTGNFVVVDGIAGAGKSTILNTARRLAQQNGMRIFDLNEWSEQNSHPPLFEDIADYDVYFTFEPTRTWVGSSIRHELSRTDDAYGGEELAHAFALDRMIMYKRLIIPARTAGKTIIQDRSVTSSIVYQPIQSGLPVETIMALPGNKLALLHAPDHLILIKLDPEIAVQRIYARNDESKGIYEMLDLLTKVHNSFHSEWFYNLMEKHNTTLNIFDTSSDLDSTLKKAEELFNSILRK
ncbi:MAG: dTMP kinase [Patescibacteria group bacterium]